MRSNTAAEPAGVSSGRSSYQAVQSVSDLLGLSAQRMLKAIAEGETNPATLAALADKHLRATPSNLCDALGACTQLNPVYQRLVKLALEELQLIDDQICRLDREMASLRRAAHETPFSGWQKMVLGVDSAQQIIAEVGAARSNISLREMSLLMGRCLPGRRRERRREPQPPLSKGQPSDATHTHQAANAAARTKEAYSRSCIAARSRASDTIKPSEPLPIGTVVVALGGFCTKESVTRNAAQRSPNDRSNCALGKMIRQLRNLGYRIEPPNPQPSQAQVQ